ncbi:hypothetical protein K1T71_008822 [Dendrolimus kikuchii]|uniref:Uncharacterized protein n=1 Tax=Dendrolimus kikuchii TaxID=765133 RepID=A0ACC1CWF5_9NEOP|nr:hypothetical protein K1T71_008822 [Dendrolimus kikuchii]
MTLVQVEQGVLKGAVYDNGVKYIAFKGIPYAKPPLGILRFKAPEPPEPWEGIRDSSEHGPVCPQYNERMDRIDEGSENCLFLNVYTKEIKPQNPLPVMIWIHGGGFYTGSGNSDYYGPEFFMAHDIILVTFNYRLEVLGFLCLDTEEVPGNAGLKDQVAALKWVKKNIASFGGDPNNITIFGCSAGAASTSYHLVSKMSKGLYNKAICQSGVCLNEWSYNLYARERAFQLGKTLGKDTDDPQKLLEFLRSLPAISLVNIKLPPVIHEHMDLADTITFGPVIEKPDKVEKFLAQSPVELVTKGHIADVPLILGYTSGEGIEIARNLSKFIGFLSMVGSVVPREIKIKSNLEATQHADSKIRKYYFNSKEVTKSMHQEVVNLETDRLFAYNIIRYARYHVHHNSKPVFLYKFIAETERNYTKSYYKMNDIKGVCHADELPYLFNVTCIDIPMTKESKHISENLVQLWTNFAKTSNPTPTTDIEQWKPFSEVERNGMVLDKTFKHTQHLDKDNIDFWENIYGETTIKG